MNNRVYVLDASAIIGGFVSKKFENYITAGAVSEIKDIKSKLFLDTAVVDGKVTIMEPDSVDVESVNEVILKSGDVLRLSVVDKYLVALAFKLKREGKTPVVVTDDYSMQNVLKIVNMPSRSVLSEGIKEIYGWIKVCKGCKKKYPTDYPIDECEICGTHIIKKRIKKP